MTTKCKSRLCFELKTAQLDNGKNKSNITSYKKCIFLNHKKFKIHN